MNEHRGRGIMKEKNIQLVEKIADSLAERGVKFHFLDERWKESGDVDMCVAREFVSDFDHIMKEHGFVFKDDKNPRHRSYLQLLNNELVKVHVHVDKYEGLPFGLLEPREVTKPKGYFLSPEKQIFYFVYKIALGRPYQKYEKYLLNLIQKDIDVGKLYGFLKQVFSNSNEILTQILEGKFSELDFEFTFSHNLSRAKMYVLNKTTEFVQRVRKTFSPAPYIAIIGPDGSGKTSTLDAVASMLREHNISFGRITGSRFRFQVLPLNWVFGKAEKRYFGKEEGVSHHARRYPSSFSRIVLPFIYFLEYLLRHLLITRQLKKRNQVVLSDRSFIDVVVSPNTNTAIAKALYRALPKPDATVYLYNTSYVLAKRKPGHPRHDLADQLKSYNSLANFFTRKIKTTEKKKVREEVFSLILSRCSLPREEGRHWLWF